MNLTIEHLNKDDRQDWQRLYEGYAVFYKMPMNDDILNQVWEWIFDDSMKFFCMLAKDNNGRAIGLMHFREMPSPLRGKMVGFLDDLFVESDSRGKGTVDAMFEAMATEAKNHDWPAIRWITAEDNYRGRGAYDRLAKQTTWVTYHLDL